MLAIPILSLPYLLSSLVTLSLVFTLCIQFYTPSPELPALPLPEKRQQRLETKDGRFLITIFSDLHYGEDEATFGAEQDRKSTEVMGKLLDYERPDFVVINGDLITGENTMKENSTGYVSQLVSPMVSRGYRWASTYGNHDTQYNLSREALFQADASHSLSYTKHSPKNVGGVTNYWLPIYSSSSSSSSNFDKHGNEKEDKPVAILWFFDSQGGENYQRWGLAKWMPNYVEASAVTWFTTQRSLLEAKYGVLPSLAFVHIPPTPFLSTQKKWWGKGKGGKVNVFPGLNDDVPVANQGEGRWGKPDGTFVKALEGTRGLNSVYSGHDHGNSWCGSWDDPVASPTSPSVTISKERKPVLCFVKHTGYGGYGTWNRGSRVVEMRFGNGGMDVESWVRMENGDAVQRVGLNETYGLDVYPAEDGE